MLSPYKSKNKSGDNVVTVNAVKRRSKHRSSDNLNQRSSSTRWKSRSTKPPKTEPQIKSNSGQYIMCI